jgi:hypothetical protein
VPLSIGPNRHLPEFGRLDRRSLGGAGFLGFGGTAQYMRNADRDHGAGHGSDQVNHQVDRLPRARSGPKLRAGFIEAPSKGPPMVPQAMM